MRSILVLLVVSLLFVACSETEKTPSGQKFTYIRKGKGDPGRKGEYILMNMSYQDPKDSIWFTSAREDGNPVLLPILDSIPKSMQDGVREVFQLLRVNDSVSFKVQAKDLFTKTWQSPVPAGVDSAGYFTFYVGVKEIMNADRLNEFQREYYEKENARAMKAESEQLKKDTLALNQYLAERNITATSTPEGVRYAITKMGKGESPNLSQTIRFSYKGMLLDGTVFDESKQPIVYPLSNLIRGWQIAFPNFPVGTQATLYIPSSLGYGPQGSPPTIPANANLIFEVELVSIEK